MGSRWREPVRENGPKAPDGPTPASWSTYFPTPERDSGRRSFLSEILRGFSLLLLCALVAAASFLAGGYFGLMRSVGDLKAPVNASTSPTYIYSKPIGDTDGSRRVLGTIFRGAYQQTASLDQMPPSLARRAGGERGRTFQGASGGGCLGDHPGALYVDIRAGEAVEGASTITQQYVRNVYLSQDRTLSRKLKEAALAIEVERKLGKDEILARYLNTAYFGSNAYGAEAAAETYFNESVEDLTLSQSATLIGLLWSPSTLGTDREGATAQRDLVLKKMFDAGYAAEQDYKAARKEPLPEKWPVAPTLDTGPRKLAANEGVHPPGTGRANGQTRRQDGLRGRSHRVHLPGSGSPG